MSFDIEQYAGAGTETLEESSSMPLLKIIQSNSPELIPQKDKFIDGAKAGDIFYAPTQEVLEQPIRFTPSAFRTLYVEWKPRTQGGGIVGMHPLTIKSHPDYAQGKDPARPYKESLGDNDLIKTTYVLGTIEINGTMTPAMVALQSAGQRTARKLQGDIRKFRYDGKDFAPPVFAQSWGITAKYEESNDGDPYYNWEFSEPQVLDFEDDVALLNEAADLAANADGALPQARIAPAKAQPALTAEADAPY